MMKLTFIVCFLVVALIADESANMINARDGEGLSTPDEIDLNTSASEGQKDDSLNVSTESAQHVDDQAGVENGGSVNNDTSTEEPKGDDDGNEQSKNDDDNKETQKPGKDSSEEEPKDDDDGNEKSKNDDDSKETQKPGEDSSEEKPKSDDADERSKDDDRKREPKDNGENCRGKPSDDGDQTEEVLEIQQIDEVADLLETEDSNENAVEEQTD